MSESGVTETIKLIKEPKAKGLAEKKKKLIKSKNDLASIIKSKSNNSVKWKKLRDVNHKIYESVADIDYIADISTILGDDLKFLNKNLEDLLKNCQDLINKILSDFYEVCEMSRQFEEEQQKEADKLKKEKNANKNIFDHSVEDMRGSSPEKLQKLENY